MHGQDARAQTPGQEQRHDNYAEKKGLLYPSGCKCPQSIQQLAIGVEYR